MLLRQWAPIASVDGSCIRVGEVLALPTGSAKPLKLIDSMLVLCRSAQHASLAAASAERLRGGLLRRGELLQVVPGRDAVHIPQLGDRLADARGEAREDLVEARTPGQMQRRLALAIQQCGVGAPIDEELADVARGREEERRLPMPVASINVRACREQHLHHVWAALEDGQMERADALVVALVRTGPRAQEEAHHVRAACSDHRIQGGARTGP
mmetsp:Transcript_125654/g.391261  ORF Transcript_125654/g.391261 Transcript_125654/m.391261 type:complete len:213 (-) Transcript_125654:15-653(-)